MLGQRSENVINEGLRLARGPWKNLCEDLLAKDEYRAALTAILLENNKQWMSRMDEDTRSVNVGGFDKFAMPIIRAVFPNLIATDLVSVQPMDGPTSLVFFLEAKYARTKGSIPAGNTAFSALNGRDAATGYSSENVDTELIATSDADDVAFSGTLAWAPVRPGSLSVKAGSVTAADTGLGTLTGSGISSGTIDYATGAVAVTFSVTPGNGVAVNATYVYDSEGNSNLPQIDLSISHAAVQARAHKIRARWSVESAQDLKAIQGLDAEAELMSFLTEQLRFDIDRGIIADLEAIAPSSGITWSKTPPSGVSYFEHQHTFANAVSEAANKVWTATRRASANWMVIGVDAANVIEPLPTFKAGAVAGPGVVHIGTLNGRWEVYKDPYMASNKVLMGYRGSSFADAGFVYAPYVPLYRTPTVYLDDMVGKVGLMSRYAKRAINRDFYTTLTVSA